MASVALHAALFLVIAFSGGRHDGVAADDTPVSRLVMLESPRATRRDGLELPPLPPSVPAPRPRLDPESIAPPSVPMPEPGPIDGEAAFDHDSLRSEPAVADPASAEATGVVPELAVATLPDPTVTMPTYLMPVAQASALARRLERLVRRNLGTQPRTQVSWQQDGREYRAELVLERAASGLEPDRVVAEVSAEDRGRQLRTRIQLKRVAFSQYAKLVDHWDPMMQLHDDEVVGRTHINSRFNVLSDAEASPVLLGKVSTAARGYAMESRGPGHDDEVFRAGLQMRAGRVSLATQTEATSLAARDADARVHAFAEDTRIVFLADGSYWLGDARGTGVQRRNEASAEPVYFLGGPDVTLYVQGVVAGRVLVYSPQRIVVEGTLAYAHDPRVDPDAGDYLGLVCDKDVVLADPRVTGPGDLRIDAAVFARRRFVVSDYGHDGAATLRIYGSLVAGTLTPSEPRYALRIEHDPRFERLRPPGFPVMKRFEVEAWDRRWTAAEPAREGT